MLKGIYVVLIIIKRHNYKKIGDISMNIYLNIDLDIKKMNEMIHYCLSIEETQINYIKLGRLDNKKTLKKLSYALTRGSNLYFYDYESLNLTLTEFKTLYNYLMDKEIKIQFLKEDQTFLPCLVELSITDAKIRSARVVDAINERRKAGVVLGRPKVESKIQKKIYDLYVVQQLPMREVAEACDVSLGTVYKYVHQIKENTFDPS